jgi:Tfp pilus assembly protein PilX
MNKTMHTIKSKQQGIVSIMMTFVLMIVISLIVLGLAQLSRREQRQSLDTQLSSQAFYAAESGLNDAVAVLRSLAVSGAAIPSKTSCANSGAYNFNTVIDTANDVSYSCLTIDAAPPVITQTLSSASNAFTLNSDGGVGFATLDFKWTVPTGNNSSNIAACPGGLGTSIFKPVIGGTTWTCPYGVLRVDIVPGSSATSRNGLISGTRTGFLVPTSSGGAVAFSSMPAAGDQYQAKCNPTNCMVTFSGLGEAKYYVRVSELYYEGGTLSISGTTTSGSAANFVGTQARVDVTGKAQDVLRRIVAAVDIDGTNENSNASAAIISGGSVCKRFMVFDTTFNDYSGVVNPGVCP